jgi:hypothetical protein
MRKLDYISISIRLVVAVAVLAAVSLSSKAVTVHKDVLLGIGDFECEGEYAGVGAGWGAAPPDAAAGTFALDETTFVTGRRSQKLSVPTQPVNGTYAAAIVGNIWIGPTRPLL